MKYRNMIYVVGMCLLSAFFCSAGCSRSGGNNAEVTPPDNTSTNSDFELSFWIDLDMIGSHLRGYWYNIADRLAEETPPMSYIENACQRMRNDYHPDKLYVIYHRQFEIEEAKAVLRIWKTYANQNNMEVVPTVVLQSYANPMNMNFSTDEINELVHWSIENINRNWFGIYDVYTRDAQGSPQYLQVAAIKAVIGNKLVMVGMQPDVALNASYKYAVQDTWTAECQGRTNELWENPVYYRGTNVYGRKLLEKWVKERVDGEQRCIVWNMIPVAWDYDTNDPLSYDCPGDNQYTNDPPIPGRIALCHKYITACYTNGIKNIKFGGYSCDLHILQANSGGRGESPSFYQAMRTNVAYNGDFGDVMREIGVLYMSIASKKELK